VVSRNGNFLINIGPRADGTIPEPQVERLQAMGQWLKINREAIYGSRYWKQPDQEEGHLAFTTNGKNLFAIALEHPTTAFTIQGTADWDAARVKSVSLLGSDAQVDWKMTDQGLKITPPSDLGASQHAWSFKIVTDQEQHSPNAIERDSDKALRGTKKVDLDGQDKKKLLGPLRAKHRTGGFLMHVAPQATPNHSHAEPRRARSKAENPQPACWALHAHTG